MTVDHIKHYLLDLLREAILKVFIQLVDAQFDPPFLFVSTLGIIVSRVCDLYCSSASRSAASGGRTPLHVAAERGFADVAEESARNRN